MILEWWTPKSPYHSKDGIIADGSIRSGKSTVMSLSFVLWAMSNFDGENFIMAGKTIHSLRRNVIKQLKKIIIGRGYTVVEHRSENYITIIYGDVENDFYLFGGKDEGSQDLVQGITAAGVFLDEVALMPESFVQQATGRCSVEGSKFWFNCNPSSPTHWFKLNWIDKLTEKNLIRIHFMMEDNPSLSQKIIERYKHLYVGVFFERFILGLWVLAEGIIYPMYKDAIAEPPEETEDTKYSQYVLSIDYGTQNAFSCGVWGKYEGIWYRIKEYYYSGRNTGVQKTDEEYAEDLDELIKDVPFGGRIDTIIDPSAASFIALLKKRGKYRVIKADNDVADGIRETATAMKLGLIKISPACKSWIKEAQGYVWDDKAKDDKPVKVDDHAMDDTRYFVKTKKVTRPKSNYKPLFN